MKNVLVYNARTMFEVKIQENDCLINSLLRFAFGYDTHLGPAYSLSDNTPRRDIISYGRIEGSITYLDQEYTDDLTVK